MNDYKITDVANWFLTKENMSHKKLQKLCYYAVAWGYALLDRPICNDDEFQAWIHGPVSPVLYEKYKGTGWQEHLPDDAYQDNFGSATEDVLDSVWLTYGEQTGNSLEALTHSELPWIKARGNCAVNEKCANTISVDDMKEYYRSIYSGGDA